MNQSSQEHQRQAADHVREQPVRCAVLTVSDTRTMETDTGGALICRCLEDAGHETIVRRITPDDPGVIRAQLDDWLAEVRLHAILTTGGTGIAKRDNTIDVIRRLLTIELDGFGELFRMLSYAEVQAAAMLSRATAGVVIREPDAGGDTLLFAMPGSTNAIKTAMVKLIVPQLPHLVWERQK
jgi:molybdenum cofactor biosynthesis protein B